MNGRVLIVGASHAGVQLASALRNRGHEGPILLAGAETSLPYHRPPLSKDYLAGTITAESLALRPGSFFDSKAIELELGVRVERIDITSGVAHTSTGAELTFDQLALATGARARRLGVPGASLKGVVYLRDLSDADRLRSAMVDARRAVVIGGGFIGLEAAAALAGRGIDVTIVEATDRLMGRAVTTLLSSWFSDLHETHGVTVRCGAGVVALDGKGKVSSVALADGSSLPADLVVIGIGVEPRTELAEEIGLTVDRGIVVDNRSRCSDPEIVAVGDVTVLPHPLDPTATIRLESVQNATDQADVAAATLLGQEREYSAVPWFWSDQYDAKLQMVGAPSAYDELVMRGSPDDGAFTVLAYAHGRLVGAECINSAADFVAVRRALAAGITLPVDRVADPTVRLKTLL
ncbi:MULTISPECIES: NAD(P)/FAD-dependent oxidoreductase [unclassified Dietzia]|uniref:NAD(P)/FAD-dependent oxidoreductase n=1 Tax=unclassified Dietzia TaxID=2617939 RepID=UPI000D200BC2|nr:MULTISPECIES: FAD-dependent oxidoreductase [unclassified Dietzia]AVZ40272.1 hypothetical protein CT688_13145 [Dietzia sp. JS16-p6b]